MRIKLKHYILTSLLLFIMTATFAGPWLAPGSLATKSDIDLLADYGLIKAPVITWPIAWDNIGPSLLSAQSQSLLSQSPSYVQQAYFRVLKQYQKATQQKLQGSIHLGGGTNINPFRTFQSQPRGNFVGGASIENQNQYVAAKLAVNYGRYGDVTSDAHVDDSYLYGFLGNWAIGFDKMNRYWGPGYSDSMILSNNAAPLPTFTVQRMKAEPFQSKWLSWIGPWSLTTSLSVGSRNAPVPNPMIWLTNISFRPLPSLQFSLSRVAYFAGSTRPLSWAMLKNLLLFQDNCYGIGKNGERIGNTNCHDAPGIEHVETSVSWDLYSAFHLPGKIYLHILYNDLYTAGLQKIGLPYKTIFLLGTSWWTNTPVGLLRTFFEWENGNQYAFLTFGSTAYRQYNIYGYGQYPYTYYGNIIGSSLGSEGTAYTFGGILNENGGNSDTFMARFLRLNGYSHTGTGYPFSRQNVLWLSLGRTMQLPGHLGKVSAQVAYLKSLYGSGLKSSPSAFITWSKNF